MSKKSDKPQCPFSELIEKLSVANKNIADYEETAKKLKEDSEMTVNDKVAAYMEKYNAAIRSFVNLAEECERIVNMQNDAMWRAKNYFTKTILK